MSPADLGDLTANLPRGCALWRAVGGLMSITDEAWQLRIVEWRMREVAAGQRAAAGDKKVKPPEPPTPPPLTHVAEARNDKTLTRAEKYIARQGRTKT